MIRSVVIDASAVLSTLLPDENPSPIIKKCFREFAEGETTITAPALLPFEVANSLWSAVRQKRLIENIARKLLQQFLDLEIPYKSVDFMIALQIAREHRLSVYDATYIQVALKENSELISLDQNLTTISKTFSKTASFSL